MLGYIIAGLVLGGLYALTGTTLAFTYQSTGVLNFSFGAIAYTVARCYYFLNSQHGWAIMPAAVVALFVLGPLLGLFLYALVFRLLGMSSTLIKIVATIGISVCLPPLNSVIFGNQPIPAAPGLAPQPVKVFHVLGAAITLDQLIVYICVAVLLIGGFMIIRFTDAGLRIRAMVDSPAMTSLSGCNPKRIALVVWAVSATMAGLVGVLVAPINGLDPTSMSTLMTAAFATVVAAKLRSPSIAALVGFGMGIANALLQYLLPTTAWSADVLAGIPLIVIAVSLIFYSMRGANLDETYGVGGNLDRAIRPQASEAAPLRTGAGRTQVSWRPAAFACASLLALPLLLHGFWIGVATQGMAYGVIFLSFTLVTGEGGMVWLCEATLAGGGGMLAALLASNSGVPMLLAILIGGLFAVPFGLFVGLLTIRMGNLYVAITTLTLGLFVDNTIFIQTFGYHAGTGTLVAPLSFASGGVGLAYLLIGIFFALALIIVNVRHSTAGLGLAAVRSSPIAARTLGISVVQMKIILAGLAAFMAGVGGALLALTLGVALPGNYSALGGEVWLAVLVTQGIRSTGASAFAGLAQTVFAGVVLTYLSTIWGNVPPILFGLGALAMVKYPDGVLTMQVRELSSLFRRLRAWTPQGYRALQLGAAVYLAGFLILEEDSRGKWWLWLLITFGLAHVLVGTIVLLLKRADQAVDPAAPDLEQLTPPSAKAEVTAA